MFIVLREQVLSPIGANTTWTSLTSRRFGGDKYRRIINLRSEESDNTATAKVTQSAAGLYDIEIRTDRGSESFLSVPAQLLNDHTLSTTIQNTRHETTIISQIPGVSGSHVMDKLHIFIGGRKEVVVIPSPTWVASLNVSSMVSKGALRAPMPSLVVEVKVKVGDNVDKGQAVVVIESMKTETVMRAHTRGVVKAVGCRNGEMVEEGRELVEIDTENVEPAST